MGSMPPWLWVTVSRRCAGSLLAGAVGATTVVCSPFFVMAPTQMVVRDQLGRPQVSTPLTTRLDQMVGLRTTNPDRLSPALVAAVFVIGVLCVLAARTRSISSGLALVWLSGLTVVLLVTPTWFKHYAALIAGPLAVTVGSGVGQPMSRVRTTRPRAALVVAGCGRLSGHVPVTGQQRPVWAPFSRSALGAAVTRSPGCVTSDDPATLVEMGVLGRNLQRGCPLVVDLGGRSYDQPTAANTPRATNAAWQRYGCATCTAERTPSSSDSPPVKASHRPPRPR